MKALVVLAVLVSMGLAYTPVCQQFRVTNFGTPIKSAGFTLDNVRAASPLTQACMLAAGLGTAVVFGTAPAWHNPTVRTIVKVAAGVAIGGFVVGMATAH